MLVECGFVRAQAGDGVEWTFTPSLGRIAALGTPHEVVALFGDLHEQARAADAARFILASLCDQEDPLPLIGWHDADDSAAGIGGGFHPGHMPPAEQVIIARHLMQHGMVGKAKPGGRGAESGRYAERFDAAEFIAIARVHLGMSGAEAEGLSMTELQALLEMKFPDKAKNLPSREEYAEAMAAIKKARERRRG